MTTWMILEDEADIRNLLVTAFQLWGIDTISFDNGTKAVAWVGEVNNGRYQGELPELAILDIRVPGPSGIDVGVELRKSPKLRHMAIVIHTAFGRAREDAERCKPDLFLNKPSPPWEEFKVLLDRAIASRKPSTY